MHTSTGWDYGGHELIRSNHDGFLNNFLVTPEVLDALQYVSAVLYIEKNKSITSATTQLHLDIVEKFLLFGSLLMILPSSIVKCWMDRNIVVCLVYSIFRPCVLLRSREKSEQREN